MRTEPHRLGTPFPTHCRQWVDRLEIWEASGCPLPPTGSTAGPGPGCLRSLPRWLCAGPSCPPAPSSSGCTLLQGPGDCPAPFGPQSPAQRGRGRLQCSPWDQGARRHLRPVTGLSPPLPATLGGGSMLEAKGWAVGSFWGCPSLQPHSQRDLLEGRAGLGPLTWEGGLPGGDKAGPGACQLLRTSRTQAVSVCVPRGLWEGWGQECGRGVAGVRKQVLNKWKLPLLICIVNK